MCVQNRSIIGRGKCLTSHQRGIITVHELRTGRQAKRDRAIERGRVHLRVRWKDRRWCGKASSRNRSRHSLILNSKPHICHGVMHLPLQEKVEVTIALNLLPALKKLNHSYTYQRAIINYNCAEQKNEYRHYSYISWVISSP